MAKKILLDSRSTPTSFTFLGISCHLKDFRLSFSLNQKLETAFVKMDDFQGCSFYFCKDEDYLFSYYLLGNRGPEKILFPDLKQTDFILLIEGPVRKAQKDQLLNQIKSITHVLTAFEVKPDTLKNCETTLNDLELHLMSIIRAEKDKNKPSLK